MIENSRISRISYPSAAAESKAMAKSGGDVVRASIFTSFPRKGGKRGRRPKFRGTAIQCRSSKHTGSAPSSGQQALTHHFYGLHQCPPVKGTKRTGNNWRVTIVPSWFF